MPTLLGIPNVESLFDEQQRPTDVKLEARIVRLATEFEWYARALKSARSSQPPP